MVGIDNFLTKINGDVKLKELITNFFINKEKRNHLIIF